MKDLGKALLAKLDNIIETWVEAVRADIQIDSSKGLTYEAVHNGLPNVLESVATLLTTAFVDEEEELEHDALEHGAVRAMQGYDLAEIVKEYRVLRKVLVLALEPELETGSVKEALKAVRKIDYVLDSVVAITLESYMEHRFYMLEQMHSQLLLTNQELTRLVQAQKDSISHLAHELKNPLNSIISFSSLLLRKQRKQLAEVAEMPLEIKQMERILENGRQLLRLINNTLEVSRKGSEGMALSVESVRVSALVKTVVDAMELSTKEKQIELQVDCELAPEQVKTDSLRLQQILTNLVSNAIRYTEEGQITITCYQIAAGSAHSNSQADGRANGQVAVPSDDRWAIAVRDTGRGISKEMQSRVFEPYFRAGNEKDHIPNSSGLGLTIVNKLVQLLEGEIQLESVPGKGSTFTVILPVVLSLSA